jgi:hypothetical protein
MKAQQGEFTFPPASHKHDPEPSKEAEKRITRSGERLSHINLVMGVVENSPGETAGAIGEITGLGHIEAQRRLSDLKNLDKVFADGKAKFKRSKQSRWWPTKRGNNDNRINT